MRNAMLAWPLCDVGPQPNISCLACSPYSLTACAGRWERRPLRIHNPSIGLRDAFPALRHLMPTSAQISVLSKLTPKWKTAF